MKTLLAIILLSLSGCGCMIPAPDARCGFLDAEQG